MRAYIVASSAAVAFGCLAASGGAHGWSVGVAAAAGAGGLIGARYGRTGSSRSLGRGAAHSPTQPADHAADKAVHEVASTDLSLLAHRIRAATVRQQDMLASIRDTIAALASAATDTAGSASRSAELAATSRTSAAAGSTLIQQLIDDLEQSVAAALESAEMIAELGDRVANVGTIAASIDTVAARTRMLALNATIEAARAGGHGRAFAVVAQEVHGLAQQPAGAAAKIAVIVSDIAKTTVRSASSDAANRASAERMRRGLINAQDAGAAFDEIVSNVDLLSRNIDKVAATSADQAIGAEQALVSARTAASAARSTAASADALGATSERIERVSDLIGAAAVAGAGHADAADALQAIIGVLRPLFDVPREHAGRFLALLELSRASDDHLTSVQLNELDEPMTRNLARFHKEICGTTVTVSPEVLADRPLWMQWWINDEGAPRHSRSTSTPQVRASMTTRRPTGTRRPPAAGPRGSPTPISMKAERTPTSSRSRSRPCSTEHSSPSPLPTST